MDWGVLQKILTWCAVINLGILFWWWGFVRLARNWTYRCHSCFLKVTEEQFDAFHYQGLMWFKLLIFFFNIVPYLAMRIVL